MTEIYAGDLTHLPSPLTVTPQWQLLLQQGQSPIEPSQQWQPPIEPLQQWQTPADPKIKSRRPGRWIAIAAIAGLAAAVAALFAINTQNLKHLSEYKNLSDRQSIQLAAKDAQIKTLTGQASDGAAKLAQVTSQMQSETSQLATAKSLNVSQTAQLASCVSATTEATTIDTMWRQAATLMGDAGVQYIDSSYAAGNSDVEKATAVIDQINTLRDGQFTTDVHTCLQSSGTV